MCSIVLSASVASATANIVILNKDLAGVGFNDPTPFSPSGGNGATTVGQARMNAFQAAANIWAARLNSTVDIKVEAQWAALSCSTNSGVLGHAGTLITLQNFPNAPHPNTSYPKALANAIAGSEQNSSFSDITATFNTEVGKPGCLSSTAWYYGLDAAGPGNAYDLVSIVTHELAHGLGFQTYMNVSTGAKSLGVDDAYLLNLERYGASPPAFKDMTDAQRQAACISEPDLLWTGLQVTLAVPTLYGGVAHGLVRMYGPSPVQVGSSVTHFSTSIVPAQLLGPSYAGPNHDPGLALPLMQDVGWMRAQTDAGPGGGDGGPVNAPAVPGGATALLAFGLAGVGVLLAKRRLLPS